MKQIINNKTVDTEARTVSGTFSVSRDADSPAQEIRYTFSYESVTDAELFERCAQSDVIKQQGRIRKDWGAYMSYHGKTDTLYLDMSASEGRQRLSDEEVARRALVRLTGDDSITISDPRIPAMIELASVTNPIVTSDWTIAAEDEAAQENRDEMAKAG